MSEEWSRPAGLKKYHLMRGETVTRCGKKLKRKAFLIQRVSAGEGWPLELQQAGFPQCESCLRTLRGVK